MNDKHFTHDEVSLMSIYNAAGTREGLIAALTEMRGYLDAEEAELRELTDSALAKLCERRTIHSSSGVFPMKKRKPR